MSRDLMFQERIRDVVRAAYSAIPVGAGRAVAERFYGDVELAAVPEAAIDWALGVGNPIAHAGLRPGETVLDLGCGGGIDTVLAARQVGAAGSVIGLDLLPEMHPRARQVIREAGVDAWCDVRTGEMESIPLPDASVDVVISNGAVNLSPRKSRTFAEVARVLRPGGRLCMVDLTVEDELPPDVLGADASWAGCIAGALSQRVLAGKLRRAGLTGIEITEMATFGIRDIALYPLFDTAVLDLMRRTLDHEHRQRVAVSVLVRAQATGRRPRRTPLASRRSVTRLQDIPVESVKAPGVTVRRLKRIEDVDLKTMDIAPGSATPFHTHVHAHEGLVVTGNGALRLTDGAVPLRSGDVFSVAPNRPHAIENPGEETLRLVCLDCFIDDDAP